MTCAQGARWLAASDVVAGEGREGPLQLRLRWRVPEWRARGRSSNIRGLDPVAFRYLYAQVHIKNIKITLYKILSHDITAH